MPVVCNSQFSTSIHISSLKYNILRENKTYLLSFFISLAYILRLPQQCLFGLKMKGYSVLDIYDIQGQFQSNDILLIFLQQNLQRVLNRYSVNDINVLRT